MAKTRIAFDGKKFRVRVTTVAGRDGRRRRFETVEHPGAAVVLPVLPDGRVLLIRNVRHAIAQELLELPAGTIDPPESPLTCARRELTEETGYVAGAMKPLIAFYSSPGILTEKMYAFVATKLRRGAARLEPGEFIRVESMTLKEAVAAIGREQIVDGKTIAALLYYDRFAAQR